MATEWEPLKITAFIVPVAIAYLVSQIFLENKKNVQMQKIESRVAPHNNQCIEPFKYEVMEFWWTTNWSTPHLVPFRALLPRDLGLGRGACMKT